MISIPEIERNIGPNNVRRNPKMSARNNIKDANKLDHPSQILSQYNNIANSPAASSAQPREYHHLSSGKNLISHYLLAEPPLAEHILL